MKKLYFFIVFYLFFLNSLYSETVNIIYQPQSGSDLLNERVTSSVLIAASKNNRSFIFNEQGGVIDWALNKVGLQNKPPNITPICQDLYIWKYDSDGSLVSNNELFETPDDGKVMIDFDTTLGTFTCLYKSKENPDMSQIYTFKMTGYTELLGYYNGTIPTAPEFAQKINPFNFFDGKYKPKNYEALGSKQYADYYKKESIKQILQRITGVQQDYSNNDSTVSVEISKGTRARESTVYGRAYQLGLIFGDENSQEKNFTVSQFLSGLITLNSDVVSGVDKAGDIVINKDTQTKMTIISKENNSFMDTFGFEFSKVKQAFSFIDYFDKKIFGLYYNFMNIGWSSVFSYGGILVLAFSFLYSGVILGYSYTSFRLDNKNEQKDWEFPLKNRLVSIVTMIVLSFVEFPVGEKTSINVMNNQGNVKTVDTQMDLSIIKMAIGFFANAGATIADVASNASITVYMDYLLKATNKQGYEDIVKSIQAQQSPMVELAIAQAFFNTACANNDEFKSMYEKRGTFAGAKGHLDNNWSIKPWDKNNQFFGNSGGIISPLLCLKMEKEVLSSENIVKSLHANNEKTLSNFTDGFEVKDLYGNVVFRNDNSTNMALTYVDMQLIGARDVGWIMSAMLPISHTYMLNANTISNTFDGLNRSSKGQKVTAMLQSSLNVENELDGGSDSMEAIIEDLDDTNLSDMVSSMLSYQVFNMLPGFTELRSSLSKMIEGGADSIEMLVGFASRIPVVGLVAGGISKIIGYAKNKLGGLFEEKKESIVDGKEYYSGNRLVVFFIYAISFALAVQIYMLILKAIFSVMITLLAIAKIGLYFMDCFIHFFVSPLLVLWQVSVKERTDKIHAWMTDGFVLYLIKPTLLVFSFFMFIIAFEILQAVFGMMFDISFSFIRANDELLGSFDFMLSTMILASMKGFSDVFIYLIGMYLAYFIILKGDTMILDKFKFKDDTDTGIVSQVGDKVQQIGNGKL